MVKNDSQIPAFTTIMNALDLLNDIPKLDVLLGNISEEETEHLYNHPIFDGKEGLELLNLVLP